MKQSEGGDSPVAARSIDGLIFLITLALITGSILEKPDYRFSTTESGTENREKRD